MRTITDPAAMRRESSAAMKEGRRVGFVPTMGSLHEGHLSLARRSRSECDVTVVSIFVNPAQFSPGEDFDRYPRDLARDALLLEREGIDVLFSPGAGGLYRPGHATWIEVEGLSERLCGPFRPGHFKGVATIVAKLINIVRPMAAYFGQKDAQQAALLKRMAVDLDLDTEVIVCPTVREADGLALSSRNAYLTPQERRAAPALYAALRAAEEAIKAGERAADGLRSLVTRRIEAAGFSPQYVEAVRASDLKPVEVLEGEILLAAAAHLGATRLIDNIIVTIPEGRSRSVRSR